MESIDLFTCLAKITKTEETTRYHIKEDLIELWCLDPVQAEAIRILGNQIIGKSAKHGQETNLPAVILEFSQPDQQLIQVPPHYGLQPPHRVLGIHLRHGRPPRAMQIMVRRRASRLREAKHLDQARVLVAATAARGHQFGQEGRVIDV